jgi:gliding motility-associated-like protein
MRHLSSRLFFIVVFVFLASSALSQSCSGSLGDPVIDQNFGAGPNPGPPLAPGITNMQYTTDNCPNDGYYTIANSLSGAGNCHPDTWQNVTSDHTGNPNGYMMIVNASEQPSIFFTQAANGLCASTTYFFSAYILNLITLAASGPGVSEPDITFTIQTTAGVVLATSNTGTIAPTAGPTWVQYGVFFSTPANGTDVVVVMTNNAPGGNGNDLILDDITFQACGPIIENGFASIGGPQNKSLCQGSSETFNLQSQVAGETSPAYQWQENLNNTGWNDISGQNSSSANISLVNANAGSYQYRVGVGNGSAIADVQCRVYSTPLTVTVNPLPVVPPIEAPPPLCYGDQLQLTASGGVSYTWTGPGISPTNQNPLVINNVTLANSGTYSVVALSDSGCASLPVKAQVTVLPKIVPVVSNNAVICLGESTKLSASGGTAYYWTPSTGLDNDSIPDPTATPPQTTTYKLHITNGACIDSSTTVTVTVNTNPVANAGSEIYLFEGQAAMLHGTIKGDSILSYSWSPTTFLTDTDSLTPTTSATDNITYTLTAVSASCGTSTSTVYVRVYKKIVIPNTFSPNNDGVNDVWNIDALVTYPECLVQVFDRYGQPVYQSTGYAVPWDGTKNGQTVPTGTYYYIIDLKNGQPRLTGWVLVVH